MKLSDYLRSRNHGAVSRLAIEIGAHAPDVSDWSRGKRPVPINRCVVIEQATDGAVSRQELRPNDWMLIWPELINQQPKPQQTITCLPELSQETT